MVVQFDEHAFQASAARRIAGEIGGDTAQRSARLTQLDARAKSDSGHGVENLVEAAFESRWRGPSP